MFLTSVWHAAWWAFTTEDKPMIEAQQRRLGDADLFDFRPALHPTDAASTPARRVYAGLVEAERAAPAPAHAEG